MLLLEARGQKRFDLAVCTSHYHGLRRQTWNSSYILSNLVLEQVIDQLKHNVTESGALQIGLAKYQEGSTYYECINISHSCQFSDILLQLEPMAFSLCNGQCFIVKCWPSSSSGFQSVQPIWQPYGWSFCLLGNNDVQVGRYLPTFRKR